MAIEKMRFVTVSTRPDGVLQMIRSIKDYTRFHPELSSSVITEGDGGEAYSSPHIYENYYNRILSLLKESEVVLEPKVTQDYSIEEIETVISQSEKIADTHQEMHDFMKQMHKDDIIAFEKLQEYPLDGIHDGLISFNFGRMPISSRDKITQYADEKFVFTELHRNKHDAWVIYVCLKKDEQFFVDLFESLSFDVIPIPKSLDADIHYTFDDRLQNIYGFVEMMSECEDYYKYIAVYNEHVVLSGFVTEDCIQDFRAKFTAGETIHDFPPEVQKDLLPPTSLKNPKFFKPFQLFIEMYGLPKYGEYDPTPFFAITYCLLFGMMFGDLGQGMVIALVGYIWNKKSSGDLAKIIFRLGIFSMIFGVIYGSFFGNEEILKPFLEPFGLPIHVTSPEFTMNLLISAVAVGVFLILSGMLTNIIISLRRKRYERALFTQNGLAGFIFYGFLMLSIVGLASGNNILNPITIVCFLVVPFLMMFFKEPLTHLLEKRELAPEEGWGGYILESVFELLEVLLGFVSNTMSFMRVGGFILSHAGMMTVVMTLQQMTGNASPIVFILGNVLVIGLEGLLVGIQALRLQYYEIFSRFYDGGGKPFKAVK